MRGSYTLSETLSCILIIHLRETLLSVRVLESKTYCTVRGGSIPSYNLPAVPLLTDSCCMFVCFSVILSRPRCAGARGRTRMGENSLFTGVLFVSFFPSLTSSFFVLGGLRRKPLVLRSRPVPCRNHLLSYDNHMYL